jgi:haloalkane dehalogenase
MDMELEMEARVDTADEDSEDVRRFLAQTQRFVDLGDAQMAYRVFGSGPPLMMLHGFPVSGLTFRKLLPLLQHRFTCYVVDIPGLGASVWRPDMDFHFEAQALRLMRFVQAVGLQKYAVLAHDTGATLARLLALHDPQRVERLVLINTEMPGHRTPWIPLYQAVFKLPGIDGLLSRMFRWKRYLRSNFAFGVMFYDKSLLNEEFIECYVRPLLRSRIGLEGMRRYLVGFDWRLLDGLKSRHATITAPVMMIWGADDPTFPVALGRDMARQFHPPAEFVAIVGAQLMVHEERPMAVAAAALRFLSEPTASHT